MDLTKTEELHNLLCLGRDSNGTPDTNDQGKLWHGRYVEPTRGLGLTAVGNSGGIGGLVFSIVLFGGSDGVLLVLTLLLLGFVGCLLGLLGKLCLGGLLLEDRLRNL